MPSVITIPIVRNVEISKNSKVHENHLVYRECVSYSNDLRSWLASGNTRKRTDNEITISSLDLHSANFVKIEKFDHLQDLLRGVDI